ncbi:MAG: cysteine desulfurase [Legionellaceae bacterium]|nr:cysteine desulfurase [Legionellaceae bacterium]
MSADLFDVAAIRRDFPILQQSVNGHPLVYLDNAATTQKPRAVIDAIQHYYETDNANVHRGLHTLSMRATDAFEQGRQAVAEWISAPSAQECIFVRGATEGINLVAQSFVQPMLKAGDEILITHLEHHSNIVPWFILCQKTGATLRVAAMNEEGQLCLDDFENKLSARTKFVAMTYASNALGTINPVHKMIAMAKARNIPVLVDAAQACPHFKVNVRDLACDFLVFAQHKMYAPTGIGVLWGKTALLEAMPPYQGGGDMIHSVRFDRIEYAPVPHKFEAGTPHIAGVIGLHAAIRYLQTVGMDRLAAYEETLLDYAVQQFAELPQFRILAPLKPKVSVISFVHPKIHPHDIGTILDTEGIAVRSGHHCAMPIMEFFGVPATTRISLSFYNTKEEIDRVMLALKKVLEVFKA